MNKQQIELLLSQQKVTSISDIICFVIEQVNKKLSEQPIDEICRRIQQIQKPKGLDVVMIQQVKTICQAMIDQRQQSLRDDLDKTLNQHWQYIEHSITNLNQQQKSIINNSNGFNTLNNNNGFNSLNNNGLNSFNNGLNSYKNNNQQNRQSLGQIDILNLLNTNSFSNGYQDQIRKNNNLFNQHYNKQQQIKRNSIYHRQQQLIRKNRQSIKQNTDFFSKQFIKDNLSSDNLINNNYCCHNHINNCSNNNHCSNNNNNHNNHNNCSYNCQNLCKNTQNSNNNSLLLKQTLQRQKKEINQLKYTIMQINKQLSNKMNIQQTHTIITQFETRIFNKLSNQRLQLQKLQFNIKKQLNQSLLSIQKFNINNNSNTNNNSNSNNNSNTNNLSNNNTNNNSIIKIQEYKKQYNTIKKLTQKLNVKYQKNKDQIKSIQKFIHNLQIKSILQNNQTNLNQQLFNSLKIQLNQHKSQFSLYKQQLNSYKQQLNQHKSQLNQHKSQLNQLKKQYHQYCQFNNSKNQDLASILQQINLKMTYFDKVDLLQTKINLFYSEFAKAQYFTQSNTKNQSIIWEKQLYNLSPQLFKFQTQKSQIIITQSGTYIIQFTLFQCKTTHISGSIHIQSMNLQSNNKKQIKAIGSNSLKFILQIQEKSSFSLKLIGGQNNQGIGGKGILKISKY